MSRLLTRRFLPNDTDAEQPAGLVSQILGLTLKEGHLPAGEAPIFKINGVEQKYSWGLQSPHNDGSLLHASAMLLCSVAIPAKSKVTVEVWSGGTPPAPGVRTLAEVYDQGLQVGGEGLGDFGGLVGTWNGYLRDDANNTEQFVYLDGDAGKTWRIKTSMAQSPGGAKHGQLEVYHYVTALTDSSGNLGGFRHLARDSQPYHNLDTPTKALRAFKRFSTRYENGGNIPLTWPFKSVAFTTEPQAFDCTVANGGTHNFYNGAQPGEASHYVNCVTGYLSQTTDPALSTGKIYFAYTYGAADNDKVFRISERDTGLDSQIVTGGGTGTFVPIPLNLHAGSIYTADEQGRTNFFQGTGSMVADSVARSQFDPVYLQSTGAIPPWNLSVTGVAFGGTIKDIPDIVGDCSKPYWKNSPKWNPLTHGPLCNSWRGGPGSVPDVAPLPAWAAAHFYNQTAVSDMAMRSIGFASDFDGIGLRDEVTGNYINFTDKTYPGLAPPSKLQQSEIEIQLGSCFGFTPPSTPPGNNTGFLSGGGQSPDHKPSMAYYAFLAFGEPHFYDLMIEAALGGVLMMSAVGRVPLDPPGFTGIILFKTYLGLRGSAWATRDLMLGAKFAASKSPDDSGIPQLLDDLVDNNMKYALALYDAKYLGDTLASQNSWRKISYDAMQMDSSCGGFMMGYFGCIIGWLILLGNADAKTWAEKYAKWINFVIDNYGAYPLFSEYDGCTIPDDQGNVISPIKSFDQYGITAGIYGTLAWQSTSPPYFEATAPVDGYRVAVNDRLNFMADQGAPGGYETATAYYARDVVGNKFNLAASKGGPVIVPTNSGVLNPGFSSSFLDASSPFLMPAEPPAAETGFIPTSSSGENDSYLLYRYLGWCMAVAAGVKGYDAALADATTRLNARFPNFSTNAAWYGQPALGSSSDHVPAPAPDPTPTPPPPTEGHAMKTFADLIALVKAAETVEDSAAAALNDVVARLKAMAAAAAGAGTRVDPAAIDALATEIETHTSGLSAAIAAVPAV